MNDQAVDELAKAIRRHSVLIADNVGLSITAEQLKRIYEYVGLHFVLDRVLEPYTPKVGDVMKMYGFGDDDG